MTNIAQGPHASVNTFQGVHNEAQPANTARPEVLENEAGGGVSPHAEVVDPARQAARGRQRIIGQSESVQEAPQLATAARPLVAPAGDQRGPMSTTSKFFAGVGTGAVLANVGHRIEQLVSHRPASAASVGVSALAAGAFGLALLSERQARTAVADTLRNWQHALDLPVVARPWHSAESDGMKHFMTWLSKLTACDDYLDPQRQQAFLGQVREVLFAIDDDEELREAVLNIATGASQHRGDSTREALNQMVLAVQNRAAEL